MKRRRHSRYSIDQTMIDMAFTLTALFAAFLAIVLHISQINDQKKEETQRKISVGNIAINAEWDSSLDADVDLWVKSPEDVGSVGYSRRSDKQTSYVRDDIGKSNDMGNSNYETSFVRGLLPGRYVVDVHMFDSKGHLPIKVRVFILLGNQNDTSMKLVGDRELELKSDGEELTAFSFELDNDGELIEGSISQEYIPLRYKEEEL